MKDAVKGRVRRLGLAVVVVAGALALVVTLSLPWLATHHVVRTGRGTVVVAKRFVSLERTFADVRGWEWHDAERNPDLRDALVHAGYKDLLPRRPRAGERLAAKARSLFRDASARCSRFWQGVRRRFGKTLCMAAELLDRGGGEAGGDYAWVAPTYGVAERGVEAFRMIAPEFARISICAACPVYSIAIPH